MLSVSQSVIQNSLEFHMLKNGSFALMRAHSLAQLTLLLHRVLCCCRPFNSVKEWNFDVPYSHHSGCSESKHSGLGGEKCFYISLTHFCNLIFKCFHSHDLTTFFQSDFILPI